MTRCLREQLLNVAYVLKTVFAQIKETCQCEIRTEVIAAKPHELQDSLSCLHFAAKSGALDVIQLMFKR